MDGQEIQRWVDEVADLRTRLDAAERLNATNLIQAQEALADAEHDRDSALTRLEAAERAEQFNLDRYNKAWNELNNWRDLAERRGRVVEAAKNLATFDDFGDADALCESCAPENPAAFIAARLEFHDALAALADPPARGMSDD